MAASYPMDTTKSPGEGGIVSDLVQTYTNVNDLNERTTELEDGFGGFHVDETTTVNPAQRMMQETVTMSVTGDLELVLGAAPINDYISVWVKTGSDAPVRLLPSAYTVDGPNVTITGLLDDDIVLIEYMYDSDETADPASASTNQYEIWADYEGSANGSDTTGSVPGNAQTGQTPVCYNSSGWGRDGSGNVYRTHIGTSSGVGDALAYTAATTWGWFETVIPVHPGGTFGLMVHGSAGTNMIYLSNTALFKRVASVNTNVGSVSQTFVSGDGQGILIGLDGSSNANVFRVYRRAGNTGPWTLVLGPTTISDLQTNTGCGIRVSTGDASNTGRAAYFKHIAGVTAPPVVS